MKFKLVNTQNADLTVLVSHGNKRPGVLGNAGQIPRKIIIPGRARSEEGKNCYVVTEQELRVIFGLFESPRPGVLNPEKPSSLSPKNVKGNTRILDTGRVIVLDEMGNHLFGIGGAAYDKQALDSAKDENAMLRDKIDTLRQVLVNDGYSEEEANAILSGKKEAAESILRKKEIGTRGTGHGLESDNPEGFSNMTVSELKAFAEEKEIDLGEAKKKDEIISVISEATKNGE